jgi:hypothetical protein
MIYSHPLIRTPALESCTSIAQLLSRKGIYFRVHTPVH